MRISRPRWKSDPGRRLRDATRDPGEHHAVQLAALLVDEAQHHRGPQAAPGRRDVERDEPIVVVAGLRPVHGLVPDAEVEVVDVRAGLRLGVADDGRAAALAGREVAVGLVLAGPAVPGRARGPGYHVRGAVLGGLDLGGLLR